MALDVVVVGGGLGGLVFAHALEKFAPHAHVTVFERDMAPDAREQGYVVGLQANGLRALETGGVRTLIEPYLQWSMRHVCITTTGLQDLLRFSAGVKEGGSITRAQLREALLQGLQVEWNKLAVRFEELPTGRCRVHFADDSTVDGDVVVAADGARSRLRAQLLPELQLQDTGVGAVVGVLAIEELPASVDVQRLLVLSQNTLVRVLGPNGSSWLLLKCRPGGPDSPLKLAWVMNYAKQGPLGLSGVFVESDPVTWRAMALAAAQLPGVVPEFGSLVEATPSSTIAQWTVWSLNPNEVKANPWQHISSNIAFIGDAAHAMTTHNGQGANTAFEDAVNLARILAGAKSGNPAALHQLLQSFQGEMSVRAGRRVASSFFTTLTLHEFRPWRTMARDWLLWGIGLSVKAASFASHVWSMVRHPWSGAKPTDTDEL